ncbi:universal stress protein [Streptomyces chiangmaiensis]|uniref:Universal stress protein n=1 Tax=Streptomyces chiangmaiensis TaxID=766497 RepID=A0ABU7FD18_9ACTN|nr:universal stress protein [Streptomyces chiangmaiensis]MED7821770.1 universal stress protein [Streptomyces chiangmaiensis]
MPRPVAPVRAGEQAPDEHEPDRPSGMPDGWRQQCEEAEVVAEFRFRRAADHLIGASRQASAAVGGRRVRHRVLGTRIDPVPHAVLHHADCPVAVVPQGV